METFSQKSFGSKIVIITSAVALGSHILSWVDVGLMRASGFQQTLALYMVFYIYPFFCAVTDRSIKAWAGYLCGTLAIVAGIYYIFSKQVEIFGRSVNMASTGVYLFIACSAVLIFGIYRMNQPDK